MNASGSGQVSLNLLVDVFNDSSEEITLKRIQIRSHGLNNLSIIPKSKVLDAKIPPRDVRTIDIWVDARFRDSGSRQTSTVRGTAIFESDLGSFRHVFVEPILEHGLDASGEDEP